MKNKMKKSEIKKTNAIRILEKEKIVHEVHTYEVDENDVSAENVAKKTGQDITKVFKTLVSKSDKNEFLVACIPGAEELSLKALAKVAGCKKVEMIHLKEVLPITGYIRGGVSPVGMKKHFRTFIHESALEEETIFVSGGLRGIQIEVNPEDLRVLVTGEFGNLVK